MKITKLDNEAIAAEYANRVSSQEPFPDYETVYDATMDYLHLIDRDWKIVAGKKGLPVSTGDEVEPEWKMIPFERDTLWFIYEALASHHKNIHSNFADDDELGQEYLRDIRIARNDLMRAWAAGREAKYV